MSYAYDFSRVPGPGPDEIKANGGEGTLTYGTGVQQSPEYLAGVKASGLQSALIWEHNIDSILGGYDYGVSEARAWNASHPEGSVIYLACDLNDGALAGRDIRPFVSGWSTELRKGDALGVYGSDDAILQAKSLPAVTHFWGVVNWLRGGYSNNDPRNIAIWQGIGVDLIQLIGSPIPDTDQNLVLLPTWATAGAAPGASAHREGVEMVIYHNVDVKDPDANTPTGEWVAVFGSDGPTNISAGEAFVHATSGVPWLDNQHTLGIVAIGLRCAKARKASAVWDSKV